VPHDIRAEALIAAQEVGDQGHILRGGPLSPVTCPDCQGTMQEIVDGGLVRYRCHTGHAYTLETLGTIQTEAWERALYGAYRAQHERAVLVRRMAEQARREGEPGGDLLEQRAASYQESAELLRRLIAHGTAGEALQDSTT
jgi:two-component system chemotaxis response regulator CheB